MFCGQTDWVGFVVPQKVKKSQECVCGGGGVSEKSGNLRDISLIKP